MSSIIIAIIFSYLLGSIPSGYILTKLLRGIDIRQHGSGNIGATNVARVVGKPYGIVVLLFDIAKGFLATTFISDLLHIENTTVKIIIAIAVVCGHNWTIFLKFCGGKGVATTIGAVGGLTLVIPGLMPVFLWSILIWLVVFLLFRIVAMASIASAVSLAVFMGIYKQPFELIILGVIFCIFIIYRHKPNINKLLSKKD